MPFAIVPQVAMALYYGGFMGLEHQVKGNILISIFTLFRSGFVILPIYIFPDIRVFFIWQAFISWFFIFIMRYLLKKNIYKKEYHAEFNWKLLIPIKNYAAGIFIMLILSGLCTQLDKIIVSKYQSLENFGLYSLASTLAQIPIILTTPIALALLPRFTRIIDGNDLLKLKSLYELNSYLISAISSTVVFGLVYFSSNIVEVWLQESSYTNSVIVALQILALGSLFLCLQLMPYHLSLAYGHTKTNRNLGFIILCLTIPSQILLTKNYGIVGASINWLALNFFAFIYLGFILNKKFNENAIRKWFFSFTIIPMGVSFLTMSAGKIIALYLNFSNYFSLFLASSFSIGSFMISLYIFRLMERRNLVKSN